MPVLSITHFCYFSRSARIRRRAICQQLYRKLLTSQQHILLEKSTVSFQCCATLPRWMVFFPRNVEQPTCAKLFKRNLRAHLQLADWLFEFRSCECLSNFTGISYSCTSVKVWHGTRAAKLFAISSAKEQLLLRSFWPEYVVCRPWESSPPADQL